MFNFCDLFLSSHFFGLVESAVLWILLCTLHGPVWSNKKDHCLPLRHALPVHVQIIVSKAALTLARDFRFFTNRPILGQCKGVCKAVPGGHQAWTDHVRQYRYRLERFCQLVAWLYSDKAVLRIHLGQSSLGFPYTSSSTKGNLQKIFSAWTSILKLPFHL